MSNGTPFADYDATYAYSQMGGKTSERAVLIVNGQVFEDWETVSVKQQMRGAPEFSFRFTCSEGSPISKNYATLQIKPGMDCVIYLAGYKAFSGKVVTRQVFYDAHRHYIEIQGANYAFVATQTSVISKTQEFPKVNYEQLAKAILKPLNVPFKVVGGSLPTLIFDRVSVPPGQYAYDILEQYARHLGIGITSNSEGDWVAVAGPQTSGGNVFVEGQNILEGREIIQNRSYENNAGQGHIPASDKKWGPPTVSVPFVESDPTGLIKNQVKQSGYSVILNEIPVWGKEHHEKRNNFENRISDEDAIWVTVTVYGWLKSGGGGLWGPPDAKGTVTSPMLIMNNRELLIKSLTFTQDNHSGTRTTIQLMNDAAAGTGAGVGRIDSLPTGGGGTSLGDEFGGGDLTTNPTGR